MLWCNVITRTVSTRPITTSRHQPGAPRRRIELKFVSDTANLAPARKAVEALAADNGFDGTAVAQIGLCVNEALANVIRHAYAGRSDRPIHLAAWMNDDGREITVTLRDWGNGIDPSTLPPRPYDPLEPGGVGLICLKQWMDDVHFTPQPDGGMLATLKKRKRL